MQARAALGSAVTVSDLRFAHLGADRQPHLIFDGLSFHLAGGSTLAIIGPSGCGKSTLLYLLAGLSQPCSGQVSTLLQGQKAKISFILQDYGLFPWKTVRENLELPLRIGRGDAAQDTESDAARVDTILAELGLSGLESRYPARLSGGQRQRVAIGRALITRPDILLMDEPFSSLDALTREQLQQTVLELWQRHRPTCILVTHHVDEALLLGQHILVMGGADGPGKPVQNVLWLENPTFGLSPEKAEEMSGTRLDLIRRIRAALAARSESLP